MLVMGFPSGLSMEINAAWPLEFFAVELMEYDIAYGFQSHSPAEFRILGVRQPVLHLL
jgi:hypothetical protein